MEIALLRAESTFTVFLFVVLLCCREQWQCGRVLQSATGEAKILGAGTKVKTRNIEGNSETKTLTVNKLSRKGQQNNSVVRGKVGRLAKLKSCLRFGSVCSPYLP